MRRDATDAAERTLAGPLRALALEDRSGTAPSRVESTVMAAWDDFRSGSRRPQPISRGGWVPAAAGALVLIATIGGVVLVRDRHAALTPRVSSAPVSGASILIAHAGNPRPSARVDASAQVRSPRSRTTDVAVATVDSSRDLARDSARDDIEWQHVVRVRMPRRDLQLFGVPLVDPESAAVVEVDVLVSDDGYPSQIWQVRAVQDVNAQETIQ